MYDVVLSDGSKKSVDADELVSLLVENKAKCSEKLDEIVKKTSETIKNNDLVDDAHFEKVKNILTSTVDTLDFLLNKKIAKTDEEKKAYLLKFYMLQKEISKYEEKLEEVMNSIDEIAEKQDTLFHPKEETPKKKSKKKN